MGKGAIITLLIIVFLAVLIYGSAIGYAVIYTETSIAVLGQIGDSFGALTSLFSGLAFSGLIITILLQRKELEHQREELRLTREELSRSSEAQQDQVEQLQHAAKVNALCTLSQVYADLSLQPRHSLARETEQAKGPRDKYLKELEKIIGDSD